MPTSSLLSKLIPHLNFLDTWLDTICYWKPLRRLLFQFLLQRSAQIYPKFRGNVKRLTKSTVVKFGQAAHLRLEAEATRYAALHTSIPVPIIYDMWTQDDGNAVLVMEFMEGELLQRKWPSLSIRQKRSVMHTLRQFIEELRALPQPQPGGWIGSANNGPCFDFCAYGSKPFGPFSNERAYNDWRISTFSEIGDMHPPTATRLKQIRDDMPDDHRITFTHGDITRGNILIRINKNDIEDVSIVALLDWEQAGWRPEYWETTKFSGSDRRESEWYILGRELAFPSYDLEVARDDELALIYGPPRQ